MNVNYLPIGTVVKLNDVDQLLMIIGYGGKIDEKNIKYDYIAYAYPNGFVSADKNFVFNTKEIEKVYFVGYKNKKYEDMINAVKVGEKNEE